VRVRFNIRVELTISGRLIDVLVKILVNRLGLFVGLNENRPRAEMERAVPLLIVVVLGVEVSHLRFELSDVLFALLKVE
jgi:hypothetical protein